MRAFRNYEKPEYVLHLIHGKSTQYPDQALHALFAHLTQENVPGPCSNLIGVELWSGKNIQHSAGTIISKPSHL